MAQGLRRENTPNGASFYIDQQVRSLADVPFSTHRPIGIASDFIDLLRDRYDHIRSGSRGESLLPRGFWERLMTEFPMGEYARRAAEELKARGLRDSARVLEVGAGVGNTTRWLEPLLGDGYIATDLRPGLIGSRRCMAWNFDTDPPEALTPASFDFAFAVNALHCAVDPQRTIARIVKLLRPGGLLLIAEGQPVTRYPADRPGIPWALNAPFGMMAGWWDRGGFRSRTQWIGWLKRYGTVRAAPWLESGHDLGGLLWVRVDDPLDILRSSPFWP